MPLEVDVHSPITRRQTMNVPFSQVAWYYRRRLSGVVVDRKIPPRRSGVKEAWRSGPPRLSKRPWIGNSGVD
jgi:hypothetical protein